MRAANLIVSVVVVAVLHGRHHEALAATKLGDEKDSSQRAVTSVFRTSEAPPPMASTARHFLSGEVVSPSEERMGVEKSIMEKAVGFVPNAVEKVKDFWKIRWLRGQIAKDRKAFAPFLKKGITPRHMSKALRLREDATRENDLNMLSYYEAEYEKHVLRKKRARKSKK
ncbi:unnamed protein product [Hyaloperonospora brassicae]|uniref:RxLR effector protein n=1 Tax=Hyaloperonospora brassicae TaxID=162125 RepID=A0AAV0U7Y7_HYABA|nr:unnamed protein product [Hyaloperonospora brassicae]